MALSFGIQDYIEGGVLAAVIVLNVSIGFYQEYGAEKKMDALRALSSPSAAVIRDGTTIVIPKSVFLGGGGVGFFPLGGAFSALATPFLSQNLFSQSSPPPPPPPFLHVCLI